MPQNADGSANCDRCGIWLPGYGVINGLICSDLNGSSIRNLIFCYRNNCRGIVLTGLINYPILGASGQQCTQCSVSLNRSIVEAMLACDVTPADGTLRSLTFCYINGSRDKLIAQSHL